MMNSFKRSLAFALSILLLGNVASARIPRASSQQWSFHHPGLIRDATRTTTSVARGEPPVRVAPRSLRDPAVRAAVARPLPSDRLRVVVDLHRSELHIQEPPARASVPHHEQQAARQRFEDGDPDRVPDDLLGGPTLQSSGTSAPQTPGVWTLPFRFSTEPASLAASADRAELVSRVGELVQNESRAWGHPSEVVIDGSLRHVWFVFPDRAARVDLSPAVVPSTPGLTRVERDPVAIAKE